MDSHTSAHCTDSGSGLKSAPYCTIQAAANVVLPGQTVHVARGRYTERVKLTRSGTATAPITFLSGEGEPDDTNLDAVLEAPDTASGTASASPVLSTSC